MKARWVLAAAVALLLGGCGGVNYAVGPGGDPFAPLCAPGEGRISGMLVMFAQAVPAAEAVPCVREVPPGWGIVRFDGHDGGAVMDLAYLAQDDQRLTVDVLPACDTGGAVEQSGQQPPVRRFDRVVRDGGRFADHRFYTYAGGCTRLRFAFQGTGCEARAAEIADVVGFLGRADVDRQVRGYTGDRLRLDPR